jgi:putative tryptophan/tyrosine transport system substrate-binding protein
MRRRDFLTLLGGTAAAWPRATRARQSVIGFTHPGSREATTPIIAAFRQGLSEHGFTEDRDLAIEYLFADGYNDRLPRLWAEVARRQVAVIAALQGDAEARAAKASTETIPIVFQRASDPAAGGLVASLHRPGGNLTGVNRFIAELMPKRVEIMCEIVPDATVVDVLVNPTSPIAAATTKDLEATARVFRRQLRVHTATTERAIEAVLAKLAQLPAYALLIMSDSFFDSRIEKIAALTLRHAIPASFSQREFAAACGLTSYEDSKAEAYRLAGSYIGRILKGEKPADLPVQQPTSFEFVINGKTARALGLTIPPPLLARADEVIE